MKKRNARIILILFFLLFSFLFNWILSNQSNKYMRKFSYTQNDVVLYLLGNFREILGSLLWIKVDVYHHLGSMGSDPIYIDRNRSIIHLIRLATWLNPKLVNAYTFGAYHLANNLNKKDEGLKFILEGLRNNPENYDINFEVGFQYFNWWKDYEKAAFYLNEAVNRYHGEDIFEEGRIRRFLAHAYYRLDRKREALDQWYIVEGLIPGTETVKKYIIEIKEELKQEEN